MKMYIYIIIQFVRHISGNNRQHLRSNSTYQHIIVSLQMLPSDSTKWSPNDATI